MSTRLIITGEREKWGGRVWMGGEPVPHVCAATIYLDAKKPPRADVELIPDQLQIDTDDGQLFTLIHGQRFNLVKEES